MNRVLLINNTKAPTREELVTSERQLGEQLFSQFPELQWAGYMITRNRGKLSANWLIPDASLDAFVEFALQASPEGYDLAVYGSGHTQFGGQTEIKLV